MLHCIDVFLAVIIEIMNCTKKCFVRKFLFLEHHTESLTLERTGVENLITTACIGRQRNQKIWFVQGEKLADSIGSGSGDYNIGQCEEVTQLFFDNEDFYRFREQCLRHRVKLPIVAGIMPFTSVKQIQRMAFTCGASIPAKVVKRLVHAGDDPADQARAGIEYACEQLEDLAANGVDGLHIYSMNKPAIAHAAYEVLAGCGYLAR